jgi:hypothetical protein
MQCDRCNSPNVTLLHTKPIDLGLYRSCVVASMLHYMCLACGWYFERREEARYVVVDHYFEVRLNTEGDDGR